MPTQPTCGDKIRGDYGVEGEIIRISGDGLHADVQLALEGDWRIVVSATLAHLERIDSYTDKLSLRP